MIKSTPLSDTKLKDGYAIKRRRRITFRQQLFLCFAFFGTFLALIAATMYSYNTASYQHSLYERQGLSAVNNFARQAELSALYESGENAKEAAIATLSFPSVKAVKVFMSDGTIILKEGSWSGEQPEIESKQIASEGIRLNTSNDHLWGLWRSKSTQSAWHYWAPIYTETYDTQVDGLGSVFVDADTALIEKEYIGYVHLIQSKQEFLDGVYALLKKNLLFALISSLVFIVLIHFLLIRLLAPMNNLVNTMEHVQAGDRNARATPAGPAEVVNMSIVYNNVMDTLAARDSQLQKQHDELENQVELRTREMVTARDEAIVASKHKSEFLHNISHELRTPLQAILGYSDILQERLADEGLDDLVEDGERITVNATHLLELITGILDLAKIEAGKVDLKLGQSCINNVISKTRSTLTPLMQQNGNNFEVELKNADQPIRIDETKIVQVLLNIASNAGKFTSDGNVKIRAEADEDQLLLQISDTGIGMDEHGVKLIFEPFQQIDGSATREFEGSGLGLAITHRFVEAMGGNINVSSVVGEGSEFTVTIPLPSDAGSKAA